MPCMIRRADIDDLAIVIAEMGQQARRRQARAQGIGDDAGERRQGARAALLEEVREFLETRIDMLEMRVLARVIDLPRLA